MTGRNTDNCTSWRRSIDTNRLSKIQSFHHSESSPCECPFADYTYGQRQKLAYAESAGISTLVRIAVDEPCTWSGMGLP